MQIALIYSQTLVVIIVYSALLLSYLATRQIKCTIRNATKLSKITYVGKLVLAQHIDWLVDLQLKNIRLKEVQWRAINFDQTRTLLDEGHCSGGFL